MSIQIIKRIMSKLNVGCKVLVAAIVFALSLAGCQHSRLKQVEQLMETDVEAADSILYTMDEPTGTRNYALYALLKTQIDYKMYRDAVSDSTIRIATSHYGKKHKSNHAAMAWYSLGCISAELGQDSMAADAYLTAIRLFPDTLVRYYALAEQNLSCIYLDHKMDAEALPMIKACYNNAIRLGDSAAMAFCEFNIARFLLYSNEYDSARSKFLELKDNKWMSLDTKDEPILQLSKIVIFKDSDYEQALNYIDTFFIRNAHQDSYGQAYSIKADAFYYLGLLDSAAYYYKMSMTESDDPYSICDANRSLSEIYSAIGNTDSASFYAKQASAWMDTIASYTGSNYIFRAILNYSNSLPKPINRYTLLIIIVPLLVFIAFIILFSLHSKSKHEVDLPDKQQMNEELQDDQQVDDSPQVETIEDFEKDLLAFKQSDLFNQMVSNINERKDLDTKEKNAFIDKYQTSPELKEIRSFIYTSSSRLNGNELDYCLFILLGFKQKDFHRLFNLSQSGCRNLKNRIKDKTLESTFNYIFGEHTGKI